MNHYYVNKKSQSTGEHEVHKEGCLFIPTFSHREYLGIFETCHDAILEAKRKYKNVDGCYYCSVECHTK